ncbi:MAG TPA: sigma factor [Micromonosporaceae bacterium]|nr:sigma factor [Micromonosporaceae bacterium]
MESAEFEEFVRQSLPALRRYARAVTGDTHTAEDLLQDTYVRIGLAWRRIRAALDTHSTDSDDQEALR